MTYKVLETEAISLLISNILDADQVNDLPVLITWNKIPGFLYFCFDINRNCSYEKVRKLFTLVLLRSKHDSSAHLNDSS